MVRRLYAMFSFDNSFVQVEYDVMRRFYAHWFHDGCPKDRGWITVLDDLEGYCEWERNGIRPSLMYCSGNTDCLFAGN